MDGIEILSTLSEICRVCWKIMSSCPAHFLPTVSLISVAMTFKKLCEWYE